MRIKEKTIETEEQKDIGSRLRYLREERDLTIENVAAETKISASNLRAIEAHDYDSLPADTFTRGFLTLYGNYLGLEGSELAARFILERNRGRKNDRSTKRNFASSSLSPKKMAEPSHIPSATVAAILLVFILVSFTGFCFYTSWNPFAFLNNTTKEISSTVLGVFHQPPTPTIHTVAGDRINVGINVVEDMEMEYKIDDQVTAHREFSRGQQMEWTAEKRMQLNISKPEALELLVNGKQYPFPQEYEGELVIELEHTQMEQ